MFRRLGPQSVEHSDGFTVSSNDRYSLKYIDNKGTVTIYVDQGLSVTINPSTLRRWSADKQEMMLMPEESQFILKRIISALEILTERPIVIEPSLDDKPQPPKDNK